MPILASSLLALALAAADPAWLGELAQRRAALAEKVGAEGVAVVLAAPDADVFRQKRDFLYLTGLDEPDAVLILEPGNKEQPETLYLKARDRAQERWTGDTLGPGDLDPKTGEADAERKHAQETTGVGAVRALSSFDADLARSVGRGRTLWIATDNVARGKPLTAELELVRDLRDRRPGLDVKRLGAKVAELRVLKSEREIAAIERAIAITLDAEREVAAALKPGLHEYESKALLEYVFQRQGGGLAFPSIVGSGMNSTVLHYRSGRRVMESGDLVVVDIGAEWDGYAADITRTWPVSGKFSPEQRTIYDLVLKAQEAALARIKPGAHLRADVHQAAVKVIDEAGYKKMFPHSTSHMVGLDVHDPGERDAELRPGMVLTVEPGVYLPEKGFGVRIEDVVLVTKDGYRLLSGALPRSADEVEALMATAAARRTPAPPPASQP